VYEQVGLQGPLQPSRASRTWICKAVLHACSWPRIGNSISMRTLARADTPPRLTERESKFDVAWSHSVHRGRPSSDDAAGTMSAIAPTLCPLRSDLPASKRSLSAHTVSRLDAATDGEIGAAPAPEADKAPSAPGLVSRRRMATHVNAATRPATCAEAGATFSQRTIAGRRPARATGPTRSDTQTDHPRSDRIFRFHVCGLRRRDGPGL